MVEARVWKWNPANGTGAVHTVDGLFVWFHCTSLDGLTHAEVAVGLTVQVVIDPNPQGQYAYRAEHIRPAAGVEHDPIRRARADDSAYCEIPNTDYGRPH
ncbi:hypothetical protein AB0C65_35565 [Nocardia sp. NPDC048505]|uniref:hypothetical protein n=1 Tax=Nocardia sp. NPDC048505 TaxID=3155756 RepID=UPI00340591E4